MIPDVDSLPAGRAGLPADGSLAIVGNAPGAGACAAAIDAADSVVRFNNALGFGGGTGHASRISPWSTAAASRGNGWRTGASSSARWSAPRRPSSCPFPMLPAEHNVPEPICWTRELLARLRPLGRPVLLLPETLHQQAHALLGPRTAGHPNPSTGFLVTLALLLGRPAGAGPAQVFGFGFDGWPGHPWAAERAWFAEAEAAGRIRVHPPFLTEQ